jgi:signal transduction histidine kinase
MMFRSIFKKLVAIYIAIVIAGFTITGAMLYFFLGNFVSNEKKIVLSEASEIVSEYLKSYVENSENLFARLYFDYILDYFNGYTEAYIFITDDSGQILLSRPETTKIKDYEISKNLIYENGYYRLPSLEQHLKVLNSENTYTEIGNFYGVFKGYEYSWLTMGKPFSHSIEGYIEPFRGVIYMHTPIPEVNRARSSVFNYFMISVAVSIAVTIILVYIFSLRLTNPLKQMNKAAKIIAGGNFQERLSIKSRDEIGELSASFNQMVTSLENLEELRRSFIANVSHELRTPMTSIRGFIEGILDGTIPQERQNEYLEIVRDETIRLNRLVNDMLDLARMEAGEMKLTYKSFNINELVRRTIIKLETLIVRKGINVDAFFEEEEVYAYADSDAIERVIYNLVHNAIKFTDNGGIISVKVSLYKDKVYVSIKDNGVGIDEDEIDFIWDRFHKSDRSRGVDKSGTGLGLAIVRNIILEHRQEIKVQSRPREGTEFIFTLERSKA